MDSFPPYRIEINGVPGIIYSELDDKKIIIAFEERHYLFSEIYACEESIDSLKSIVVTYEQSLSIAQSIREVEKRRLEGALIVQQTLQGKLSIQHDVNKRLQFDYNKLQKKRDAANKRNGILYTTGGIVLTGLIVGIIVKSVL